MEKHGRGKRRTFSAEYKAERRPMPDLLREQFPHFRPIVEAFGYRNLEFEGWEADDVIATLATALVAEILVGSLETFAEQAGLSEDPFGRLLVETFDGAGVDADHRRRRL